LIEIKRDEHHHLQDDSLTKRLMKRNSNGGFKCEFFPKTVVFMTLIQYRCESVLTAVVDTFIKNQI
jgi:hypothetical protein